MGKKKISQDKYPWALAMKKYRLNAPQIAMAKELGMNPEKFGKLVPNKSEPWKEPLGEFIERCYFKRFKGRERVGAKNRSADATAMKKVPQFPSKAQQKSWGI